MNQVAIVSFGERVLNATRQGLFYLRGALDKLLPVEPADNQDDVEVKELLSEKNISFRLLWISVLAIFFKVVHYFIAREWLQAVATVFISILAAPIWIWMTLTSAFMPLVCGIIMAVITWYTVFLDRCIPGVYPPSPVWEKKYWIPVPLTFHVGYSIAVVNGIILALLIYLGYNNA